MSIDMAIAAMINMKIYEADILTEFIGLYNLIKKLITSPAIAIKKANTDDNDKTCFLITYTTIKIIDDKRNMAIRIIKNMLSIWLNVGLLSKPEEIKLKIYPIG